MNPQDWDRCKQIFCEALDLGDEERVILLERECAGEAELRSHVQEMLDSAGDASPLDVSGPEQVLGSLRPAEPLLAGDVVGHYRVRRHIGQGGTSLVYLAEHVGLQGRRFAIKVIASAFLAGQHQRFERECEILAAFEHPNIARIIDKGVTESGWPYLVMEYIDGTPIHQYCVDKKLAPPEIVRLMLECCRAIRYIHGNLIVHCDLKPTNILVDATGSPRILDFGIARLIEPGDHTRSGQTTRGIRPLTPDYASPEQLAGRPLTTSTDIYSIGVVLYQCLARSLPFDNSDLPWTEISERLANQGPAPPSKARLSGSPTREDAAFARQLRGDLDSIVLKALSFDPAERYRSMDDLMADLSRYLEGEVVHARLSSVTDWLSKFLRRHQRAMAEALAMTTAIALAIGLSFWYTHGLARDRAIESAAELRAFARATLALPDDLPDSVRARDTLAERLSNAIEIVEPRSRREAGLVSDLADALVRTGDLLGNPYGVNQGRVDEARAYYRRALDLVRRSADARCGDIRARACLGLGDTYGSPLLSRDPAEAVRWYQRALSEVPGETAEFRATAAIAHGRLGMICELVGEARDASVERATALSLFPRETDSKRPLDFALSLVRRAEMAPSQARDLAYREAIGSLDAVLAKSGNSRARRATIDAHLALGLSEMQAGLLSGAETEFAAAVGVTEQLLARDPDDLVERRQLAVALRRSALVPAAQGRMAESDALREQATQTLRTTMAASAPDLVGAEAGSSCADAAERVSTGDFPSPLRRGDLLIGNRSGAGGPGKLLVFSPGSRELSVLATGGYLSDLVDVAVSSATELYLVDRGVAGAGGIVRLRYEAGHWLQWPVTCGGLLRRPTAVAYRERQLVVVDADEYSARLIAIDPITGRQTPLSRTGAFTEPGKIVRSPGGFYLGLFWSGEGGPAEIARFDSRSRRSVTMSKYGLLDDPVALAITPQGELIAANRTWAGNGGSGEVLRVGSGGGQRVIVRNAGLSRVTSIAAGSGHQAWYAIAAAPFAPASLYRLDLLTGQTEEIMSGGILTAPNALASVE
jgi:serine/threonine protein kinase